MINIFLPSIKTIAIMVFFLTSVELYPMVLAVSCLKRLTGRNRNRIVLLHQQHALDHGTTIKKGHIDDMFKLMNVSAKNPNRVPFVVGISEADRDPQRLKNVVQSPAQVAIKTALDNNMKYESIDFMSFDNRVHLDFWIRDMLVQRN